MELEGAGTQIQDDANDAKKLERLAALKRDITTPTYSPVAY